MVLARGDTIATADLPLHLGGLKPEAKGEGGGFAERVMAFEKALIDEALDKAGGVQTRVAAALGMSERHLRYRLKKSAAGESSSRPRAFPEPHRAGSKARPSPASSTVRPSRM